MKNGFLDQVIWEWAMKKLQTWVGREEEGRCSVKEKTWNKNMEELSQLHSIIRNNKKQVGCLRYILHEYLKCSS